MKKKPFLTLTLIILVCLALVGQAIGQTRAVGIHEGDEFIYTITASWNSNDKNAIIPSDLIKVNQTRWYNVTILSITNTNVSSNDIWHFANGTETTAIVVQNVATGINYVMNGLVEIASANLNPNDKLYDSADDPRWINQTVSVDYGSTKRDTNMVSFSFSLDNATTGETGIGTEAFYFDKATGIMIAKTDTTQTPTENTAIIMLLIDTNLWHPTTIPTLSSAPIPSPSTSPQASGIPILVIAGAAVAATLAVIIVLAVVFRGNRKRKRKTRR